MAVKIDIAELERIARAAESDQWQWRPANDDVLEGIDSGQVVLAGEDLLCSVSDRAHIAANSPPVTLALIARIRELEAGWRQLLKLSDAEWSPTIRALLEKGVALP